MPINDKEQKWKEIQDELNQIIEIASRATPKSLQRPEVACSEWVEELEAALRHAKSAREGIEKRDGSKTFTYGLNGAIGLLSQAVETERSRSSTSADERPASATKN